MWLKWDLWFCVETQKERWEVEGKLWFWVLIFNKGQGKVPKIQFSVFKLCLCSCSLFFDRRQNNNGNG